MPIIWAERCKLETYLKTRAAQIVKVRGMVMGITITRYEALLELATGGEPQITRPVDASTDLLEYPGAQRRFRVVKMSKHLNVRLTTLERNGPFSYVRCRDWLAVSYSDPFTSRGRS